MEKCEHKAGKMENCNIYYIFDQAAKIQKKSEL